MNEELRKYFSEMGKKGAAKLKEKYGNEYFSRIAKLPRKRKRKKPKWEQ